MFSIEQLHELREAELAAVAARFPMGARVLEFGAGTGEQARLLAQRGFRVAAVDIPASCYAGHRVFHVLDFDGRRLPFRDGSFDVVFSSNVLEHIRDLPPVHAEITRVLAPGGICVHILPSTAWRFWTSLSAFPNMVLVVAGLLSQPASGGASRTTQRRWVALAREVVRPCVPLRHGEVGNAISELWRFSRRQWIRHFHANGFVVARAESTGLFYTGCLLFGTSWSLSRRQRIAAVLGSACNIFVMRPTLAARVASWSAPQHGVVQVSQL